MRKSNAQRKDELISPPYMTGAELRRIRREMGLSQTDFGKLIDRNTPTVSIYETGRAEIPELVADHVRMLSKLPAPQLRSILEQKNVADARRTLAASGA